MSVRGGRDEPEHVAAGVEYFGYLAVTFLQRNPVISHIIPVTADLVVLAVFALERAMVEKHVAYPLFASQHRLFAFMDAYCRYVKIFINAAESLFLCPVNAAVTGTQITVGDVDHCLPEYDVKNSYECADNQCPYVECSGGVENILA